MDPLAFLLWDFLLFIDKMYLVCRYCVGRTERNLTIEQSVHITYSYLGTYGWVDG